ncbi:outer membrane protein [Synechococcus sp. LTW-R]|uniref:outer membrane protein n=1 Tax=Synechococcus sp. LTW-R TaxID=2751170 RepID=UPI0016281B8D|nr:outer membrane beta-barrel protein [Synechococcus sp. LTW-R]QNG30745.1 hypothetical protein H0O22_06675 [Synechococcus sp. LTW-R]
MCQVKYCHKGSLHEFSLRLNRGTSTKHKMRVHFRIAAAAATFFAVSSPVFAQDPSEEAKGFYATLGAGASWTNNTGNNEKSYSGVFDNGDAYSGFLTPQLDLGVGFAGEAGFGYDFGDIRAELTYLFNGPMIGEITGSGHESGTNLGNTYTDIPYGFTITGTGTLSTNSIFASAYYDIETKSKFTPYVGGGIGYTNVSVPTQSGSASLSSGATGTFSQSVKVDGGNAGAFGYLAKAGVAYAATSKADVFVEATYNGSTAFSINGLNYSPLYSYGARAGVRIRL